VFLQQSSQLETVTNPCIEVSLLSGAAGQAYAVNYRVIGGTATRNVDYTLADGTLAFSQGQASAMINLNVSDEGHLDEKIQGLSVVFCDFLKE